MSQPLDERATGRMVVDALTLEERARHERAIARIRSRLFRKHAPEDSFIIAGTETVLAASAESCWNAGCGEYRVLRLGGLSYSVDCADKDGLASFAVSHIEADRFNFSLSAAKGYTLNALTLRFCELDEVPHSYVCSYRRANLHPVYVGQRSC